MKMVLSEFSAIYVAVNIGIRFSIIWGGQAMKALSIYPEPVMEIFMGDKMIEYRTWQTDYRGDLLICAGSKREPGYVNGYAWFVVSLLDVRAEDGGE